MANKVAVKQKEIQFLMLLRAGNSIKDACESLGVSRQWLYQRKRYNADFATEVNNILSKPAILRSDEANKPIENWQQLFIDAFIEEAGSKTKAAKVVGKAETEIYAMLNPMHPKYNKNFADAVSDAENMVIQKLLDVAHEKASEGDNQMIIQCLKWLDPERFGDKRSSDNSLPLQVDIRVSSEDMSRKRLNDFIDAEFTAKQISDSSGAN